MWNWTAQYNLLCRNILVELLCSIFKTYSHCSINVPFLCVFSKFFWISCAHDEILGSMDYGNSYQGSNTLCSHGDMLASCHRRYVVRLFTGLRVPIDKFLQEKFVVSSIVTWTIIFCLQVCFYSALSPKLPCQLDLWCSKGNAFSFLSLFPELIISVTIVAVGHGSVSQNFCIS